jgi:hypothetical protein
MGRGPQLLQRDLAVAALAFVLALTALFGLRAISAPHYKLSAAGAIAAARADDEDARYLATHATTRARSIPLDREDRRVTFFDGPRVVLDAAVRPDGRIEAREEHPPGVAESGAPLANHLWMLGLMTGLFLLAVAVVPLRRMRNLDALALAGFGATVLLFNARLVAAAVAVGSPLLAYLAARCLSVGLRGTPRARGETPLYEWLTRRWEPARRKRMLWLVTGATLLAFLAITLTSTGESDVATATLSGATRLLHGESPYGHVVGAFHGDTYGLLAYMLYVPGALWTPVTDVWSDVSGALAVTAVASVAAGVAMHRLGGTRALLAWLAFPPVLLAASGGSNDLLLAAVLAWALLAAARQRRAWLLLAAGAWIKVVPLVLAPLWLARTRPRSAPRELAPAALLVAGLSAYLLALGGVDAASRMVHALEFQFQRGSFHAPWYAFGVTWLQPVVQAAVVAALAVATLRVACDADLRRDPVRLAALGGALVLGVQLSANYWTWSYLPWALPFVAVGLLALEREHGPLARHAAQLVIPAELELEARADDGPVRGSRGEDLARLGERRHARGDVDGHPAHVVADNFAFSRVQSDVQLDPERPHGFDD